MKITETPRTPAQRRRDVLARLEREEDVWAATAAADGTPWLVALWFLWDGEAVWLATRTTSPTGRNLRDGRRVRLALGDTQDVVLIDGEAEVLTREEVPAATARAYIAKYGWDPGADSPSYAWFRVRPRAVQALRGEHEMKGRHLMRDGVWTV
ncbi:pyridoxamine 5'-phosphate oxidase family protein [Streptomyces pharetrae]|uniref:Pyridoxamine 5'-phosphate oxidase n=1 Tax=Streptomyces pharetrae CZA14 TaxID=1144883 RepID=A0ABX3YB65_9ACTN|nr:pyridoxamine 5'-phosphate oxidase [Streptomyces pharetrae CZA14]